MRVNKYLAFDLGAGSGRAILGELSVQGKLRLTEIHRFPNRTVKKRGRLYWDTRGLFSQIRQGLALCADHTKKPDSIGIDAWGVDFGLLDASGKLLENSISYRDNRTDGIPEEFFKKNSAERLYKLTGIQIMQINTVFQLFARKRSNDKALKQAETLLFTPDLMNYFLTGKKAAEFTVATTSQLYNPARKEFSGEIFKRIGVDPKIMARIVQPGNILGNILPEVLLKSGLKGGIPVVNVASHDTASAVAAIPARHSNFVYISSGSWSLIGYEAKKPCITLASARFNFTNEGGAEGTFRILKNINGLWLLQEIARNSGRKGRERSISELMSLARKAKSFTAIINPNDPIFLKPCDMPGEIRAYCKRTGQYIPSSEGELVRVVLESLALSYRRALEEIKLLRGKSPECIHIIGGGANNTLLCELTASATGLPVYAGPTEAASAGNILLQARALGRLRSLEEMREVSRRSFKPKIYEPKKIPGMDEAYGVFQEIICKRGKNAA
ncbi:MAG: rhamnulokinase family protein [Candidatus Firestonebacteria bacterium]